MVKRKEKSSSVGLLLSAERLILVTEINSRSGIFAAGDITDQPARMQRYKFESNSFLYDPMTQTIVFPCGRNPREKCTSTNKDPHHHIIVEAKISGEAASLMFEHDKLIVSSILGKEVEMHKYAIQITVADVRNGACSSSTLKEACSAII